jgi:hypothetical protein
MGMEGISIFGGYSIDYECRRTAVKMGDHENTIYSI